MKKKAIKITALCIAGLFTSLALANEPVNTCPDTVTWHPDASLPYGGYITGNFSDGEVLSLPVSGSPFDGTTTPVMTFSHETVFKQDYVSAKYQTAAQKNLKSVVCQFTYWSDNGGIAIIQLYTSALANNYIFVPADKESYQSDAPRNPNNKSCEAGRDCEFTLKAK